MAPPAFQLQASAPPEDLSNASSIQRASARPAESDMQGEKKVEESNYARLTYDQQLDISRFCQKSHATILKWEKIRPDSAAKVASMNYADQNAVINEIFEEFQEHRSEFYQTFHGHLNTTRLTYVPGSTASVPTMENIKRRGMSHRHFVTFNKHPLAKEEMYRQLNSGKFPQYLQEITRLYTLKTPGMMNFLKTLFNEFGRMNFNPVSHTYYLKVHVGLTGEVDALGGIASPSGKVGNLEGSAGLSIPVGAHMKAYAVSYENELGIKWTMDFLSTGANFGAAVGAELTKTAAGDVSKDSLNQSLSIESSYGTTYINAGTARPIQYFPPQYFRKWNLNTSMDAGASGSMAKDAGVSAGGSGGQSEGMMRIGNLDFDTSGWTQAFSAGDSGYERENSGTTLGGEMNINFGMGLSKGRKNVRKFQGLGPARERKEKARKEGPLLTLIATIHFKSDEFNLDSNDKMKIARVADHIKEHEIYYPGDPFVVRIAGTATQRWITPEKSARERGIHTSDLDQQDPNREDEISDRLNIRLAGQRANTVKEFLKDHIFNRDRIPRDLTKESTIKVDSPRIVRPKNISRSDNHPNDRYVTIKVFYDRNGDNNIHRPMKKEILDWIDQAQGENRPWIQEEGE